MRRKGNWSVGLACVFGVLLGAALSGLVHPGGPAFADGDRANRNVVTAHEFRLVGQDGKVRGTLTTTPDGGARLLLKDAEGAVRVKLEARADGRPALTLLDGSGRVAAQLALGPHGTTGLFLRDSKGNLSRGDTLGQRGFLK